MLWQMVPRAEHRCRQVQAVVTDYIYYLNYGDILFIRNKKLSISRNVCSDSVVNITNVPLLLRLYMSAFPIFLEPQVTKRLVEPKIYCL